MEGRTKKTSVWWNKYKGKCKLKTEHEKNWRKEKEKKRMDEITKKRKKNKLRINKTMWVEKYGTRKKEQNKRRNNEWKKGEMKLRKKW